MKARQVSATCSICRCVAAASTPATLRWLSGSRDVYMKSSSRDTLAASRLPGRHTLISSPWPPPPPPPPACGDSPWREYSE